MVFQRKYRTQVSDKKDFYFSNKKLFAHCTRNRNRDFVNDFYESNISTCYKCKRTLITKSTSFSELQSHQTPMVKLGLANLYNNYRENSERFKTINHFPPHTIGNNKRENSLRRQSYLSAAKTIQTRESAFKILNTIDKAGACVFINYI